MMGVQTTHGIFAIALQRTMLIFMPYTKKTVVSVQPEIQELRIAKGEFITFIDSDDYVKPDYLQKLVEGQEADLVLCGFRSSTGIDFTPEPQYLIGDDLSKNIQAIVENDYLLIPLGANSFVVILSKNTNTALIPKFR